MDGLTQSYDTGQFVVWYDMVYILSYHYTGGRVHLLNGICHQREGAMGPLSVYLQYRFQLIEALVLAPWKGLC